MAIAWGIEVLEKRDFFSGEVPFRLIGHPLEKAADSNQSSEDSNSTKENAAKPAKKDFFFCQGPESMDGMEG